MAPLNVIERCVLDWQFQVGIIPGHCSADTLTYDTLFDETMFLYCAASHPLFDAVPTQEPADWAVLQQHRFAVLGYHSPNREAWFTGYDQESIATLILSSQFLVFFLPDHYAESFVRQGPCDGSLDTGSPMPWAIMQRLLLPQPHPVCHKRFSCVCFRKIQVQGP